jgi:hypothetical protein
MKLRTNLTHMGRGMSNSKRAKDRRQRERVMLFDEAILDGHTSRRDICTAMNISSYDLTGFFDENPKLYKIYASRRRELRDTALDNITDIIEDKSHPKHYDASKYIVQNYRTDLDVILESKEDGDISSSSVSVDNKGSGVIIKFTKGSDKEKEE